CTTLNAVVQKKVKEIIIRTNKKIAKYQEEYNSTTDLEPKYELINHIQNLTQVLNNEDKKLQSLKKNANYQCKCREKKDQDLNKHQQVVKYGLPGHSSVLHKYLDLLEHIHESIKFSAADSKRKKEVIKIQTVIHLQEALKSKYDEHLFWSTVYNYLIPHYLNIIKAKNHYHPTNVQ
ncbi:5571_t:CDS:1, partial [Cetraspora pellucida]